MSVEPATTKRKHDSPSESKAKKPRTSESKKDRHSKPRSSDAKKHKSNDKHHPSSSHPHKRHSSTTHHRSSQDVLVQADDSDEDNATAVSPYRKVFPFLHMAVPPVFGNDPARAVAELFDTMLLQYVAELDGVLVTHHAGPKCFQRPTGRIEADGAFGLVPAKVGCLVWSPRIGMKLEGKIALSSPSHVSLLLDGLFNASISSQHLDLSQWEFVHEEHEEQAQEQAQASEFNDEAHEHEEKQDVKPQMHQDDDGNDDGQPHSLGYWRNKIDLERLGGASGKLTFTVVSMTVAKHMLTLHGSLLRRPFSVPPPDEQDQGIDATLPPMEGDARTMTTSQRIMYNRRQHLLEQKRQQQAKTKEETDFSTKSQNKRVRWDDDEDEAEDPATTHPPSTAEETNTGAVAGGTPQGTKITFD